ncbi:MAG: ABC transporter permease, partial [Clostridia bacterium]|nr:ABC transporter permease [Clostridia bacterium]
MRIARQERGIQNIDIVKLAWASLRRSRTRTFRTVLGVVIGTACIALMLSIGWSGYSELTDRIAGSDSLTLIEVWPDPAQAPEITDAAVAAFAALDHVEAASAVLDFPARLETGRYEAVSTLRGIDPAVLRLSLAEGSIFGGSSGQTELVIGAGALRDFVDPVSPPDFGNWETYQAYRPDVDWLDAEIAL